MNAMTTMARAAFGAAALAVLAGCATGGRGAGITRHVDLRMSDGWEVAARTGDGRAAMVEYVPAGESVERWTRFVSVQTFATTWVPFPGAGLALSRCRALLVSRCPTAAWTVLRESGDDALYEWRVAGCDAEPDQHEVGRVLNGRGTWARMTFSVKGEMDAATREEWLRRLSEARLAPGAP